MLNLTDRFRRSNDDVLSRAKRKTLRMTITIVIVFIVSWTPFYVMSVWWVESWFLCNWRRNWWKIRKWHNFRNVFHLKQSIIRISLINVSLFFPNFILQTVQVLVRQRDCIKSGSKDSEGTISICMHKFVYESNCVWPV